MITCLHLTELVMAEVNAAPMLVKPPSNSPRMRRSAYQQTALREEGQTKAFSPLRRLVRQKRTFSRGAIPLLFLAGVLTQNAAGSALKVLLLFECVCTAMC